MTTLLSKFKKLLHLVLANSNLVLFLCFFGYLAIKLLSQIGPIKLDSFTEEMQVFCRNSVVVENESKRYDLSVEVLKRRGECDATIASENNKTAVYNKNVVKIINSIVAKYELRYQDINTASPAIVVPLSTAIDTGILGNITFPTEIETMRLNNDTCESASESKSVQSEADKSINNMVAYAITIFWVTLCLNIFTKFSMTGFSKFFWMELTRGYSFDEPFTSDDLRGKIRTARIMGVSMIILGLIGVIAVVSAAKLKIGNLYQD
jgi:hypothetical protein